MLMSSLRCVSFSEDDIESLKTLLEQRDGIRYYCDREMSGIWIHSADYQKELRLLILGRMRVTVSRVCFNRKRVGTMTAVLSWLKDFCNRHPIPTVLIQCVETKAMESWCCKNGFVPCPAASALINGIVIGDYQKVIAN